MLRWETVHPKPLALLLLGATIVFLSACAGSRAEAPAVTSVPRSTVLAASSTPRGTPWAGPTDVPILMYHHVSDTRPADTLGRRLTVLSSDFEQQLAYLKCAGYSSVSLSQLFD